MYKLLFLICLSLLLITPIYFNNQSKISKLKGIYRIGPHNKDVISIIFGSLLGDAYAEKRFFKLGTRFSFSQEASHVKYLMFLHKFFSELGYCNPKLPVITTRLGNKGKVRKVARFIT
jgi:ubiquinol-cytochrome c reductase cytochrome b subunit